MEQYIIPAAAAIIVAIIEALAASDRSRTKKDREKAEAKAAAERKHRDEQETAREQLMLMLIQSTSASIALGEATAKAVQRIPDAKCNGDMSSALAYATSVKHTQKEFLAKQGIHSLWE